MEITEMVELYQNGSSTGDIAKLAGFKTAKSIADKLKQHGILLRHGFEKYSLMKNYDDNLFKIIDSPWKAYFLGLLLTDGWISSRNPEHKKDIVGFSSIDLDVVQYISLHTGKNIQYINRASTQIGPAGKIINQAPEYRICLNSTIMVEDLERLGVIPNKTHILKGPQLTIEETKYLRYIIRGIIDGDGTLGFPSNKPSTMYFRIISASEEFIDWCIWALEYLGMDNLHKHFTTTKMWEVNSARPTNLAILTYVIYKDQMGMMRKYKRIQNHFHTYTVGGLTKQLVQQNPLNCGDLLRDQDTNISLENDIGETNHFDSNNS